MIRHPSRHSTITLSLFLLVAVSHSARDSFGTDTPADPSQVREVLLAGTPTESDRIKWITYAGGILHKYGRAGIGKFGLMSYRLTPEAVETMMSDLIQAMTDNRESIRNAALDQVDAFPPPQAFQAPSDKNLAALFRLTTQRQSPHVAEVAHRLLRNWVSQVQPESYALLRRIADTDEPSSRTATELISKIRRLSDETLKNPGLAQEVVSGLGSNRESLVESTVRMLESNTSQSSTKAAINDGMILEKLAALFPDSSTNIRELAHEILDRRRSRAESQLALLSIAAKDPQMRAKALTSFEKTNPKTTDPKVIEDLAERIKDPNIGKWAAEQIERVNGVGFPRDLRSRKGASESPYATAHAKLGMALNDPNISVDARRELARAFARHEKFPAAQEIHLAKALSDPDSRVRTWAKLALYTTNPPKRKSFSKEAEIHMAGLLSDPEKTEAILDLFDKRPPASPESLAALRELAKGSTNAIKERAARIIDTSRVAEPVPASPEHTRVNGHRGPPRSPRCDLNAITDETPSH